jgi:hypothetical protein
VWVILSVADLHNRVLSVTEHPKSPRGYHGVLCNVQSHEHMSVELRFGKAGDRYVDSTVSLMGSELVQ